jgi:two-component system, OmpR family, heavy metal sensor histidine kinase CusS
MFWKNADAPSGLRVRRRAAARGGHAGLHRPRSWSITTRLTILYGVSAFATLVLAIGIAYWSMLANMERADRKFVNDKIQVLQGALSEHAGNPMPLRQEVEWERVPSQATHYFAYYSRVTDASKRLLIETPGIDAALADATFPRVQAPIDGEVPVVRWRSKDGRSYLLATGWGRTGPRDANDRIIQVALDVTPEDAVIAEFRRQLALVLVVGLILSTAVGNGVARRGMRPLAAIADTVERITASRLYERIDPARWPTELAALAAGFDHMLERLEDSFARLSRFSADLAHELRTPINNLMGEAEVALSRARSPEEYRHVLESSLEEFHRLSRTIENLLFLARADDARQPMTGSEFDVREALETVCEFHSAVAEEKGITVRREGEARLWADPLLFQRAVGNVLANALRHTPAGGQVRIAAVPSADGSVDVSVEDTGSGIATNDLPRVFDRFFRAERARTLDPGGTGLGLAIVKSIMEMHGGEAGVQSPPGHGTTVTLHFPARLTKT